MSRAAGVLSAASFLALGAHIAEDFVEGVYVRFGLTLEAAAWLFGLALFVQTVAAMGASHGRRWGLVGVALFGIGWAIAAAADHPGAFTRGPFRMGMPSRLWVWLLVAIQAAAAVTAVVALVRGRRGALTVGTEG
ncbi:MAG: hypothetical protein M3245_06120 [Actinomycetota bacterium]|nr:hypothetical protein [Actinomycetota bacterium]